MGENEKNTDLFWPMLGISILAALAALVVMRHVVFYDEFAEMTIAAGDKAPPLFPIWQRISLASAAALGLIAAPGILFHKSWGIYLFVIAFILSQTFAFAIGQWGLPSFLLGLSVIILGMNYLHSMK